MKKLLGFFFLGFLFSLNINASEAPSCRGAKYYPFVFQECMNKIFAKENYNKCYNMVGSPKMYQSCFNRNLGKMGLIACTQLTTDPFAFESCVNLQLRRRHDLKRFVWTIDPSLKNIQELVVRIPREDERSVNDSGRESEVDLSTAITERLNLSRGISR